MSKQEVQAYSDGLNPTHICYFLVDTSDKSTRSILLNPTNPITTRHEPLIITLHNNHERKHRHKTGRRRAASRVAKGAEGDNMNWVETLNNAIEYIEDNLLEDITLTQIAGHVHISSAYLQRGFSALADLTVGEYIRNRRLSLAGLELTHKNVKVIDIAVKYGYETSESFSKAFSRFHGIAPSAARHNSAALKSYSRLTIKIMMEGGSVMDYRIEEREGFSVVVKARRIEPEEGDSTKIPAFWDDYFAEGLAETIDPELGVCGEMSEDTQAFDYGIGGFLKEGQEVPEGFEVWQVPKSTWAVFKCVGTLPKAIQEMWRRIFGEWLPQAKYEILPSYDFELYLDGDSGSTEYVSEIWLPVKKK